MALRSKLPSESTGVLVRFTSLTTSKIFWRGLTTSGAEDRSSITTKTTPGHSSCCPTLRTTSIDGAYWDLVINGENMFMPTYESSRMRWVRSESIANHSAIFFVEHGNVRSQGIPKRPLKTCRNFIALSFQHLIYSKNFWVHNSVLFILLTLNNVLLNMVGW